MPLRDQEPRSSKAEDTLPLPITLTLAVTGELPVHTGDPNLPKASGMVRPRAPHKDQTRHNYRMDRPTIEAEGLNTFQVYFPAKLILMEPAAPSTLGSFVYPQPLQASSEIQSVNGN